ncbi:MAG: hypothetical protein ACI4XG_19715 [Bradyrhizobium sp.]
MTALGASRETTIVQLIAGELASNQCCSELEIRGYARKTCAYVAARAMDAAQFLLNGWKINTEAPAGPGYGATIDHKLGDQRRIAACEQEVERIVSRI